MPLHFSNKERKQKFNDKDIENNVLIHCNTPKLKYNLLGTK